MGTWGHQEVLPVGRGEYRVEAHVVGARLQLEYRPIRIPSIHRHPSPVERVNGGHEDDKVQASRWLTRIAILPGVGASEKGIVQGVKVGSLGNSCSCPIEIVVVIGHILR